MKYYTKQVSATYTGKRRLPMFWKQINRLSSVIMKTEKRNDKPWYIV